MGKKKTSLVILALCCSIYSLYGQYQLGVRAGINLNFNKTYELHDSFSQGTTTIGQRVMTRFVGGLYGNFSLADKLYIQPEVLYSQQYNIIEASGEYWLYLQEGKVDYLNVPILLQYEVASGLRLEAGPQIGFPLYSPSAVYLFDITDRLRAVDAGVVGGLGYELPRVGLGFFGRYTHGLDNLAKAGEGSARNKFCSFGLYYALSKLWL